MTESQLEQNIIERLEIQGYKHIYGPDIAPDITNIERESFEDVILKQRLINSIKKLNPNIPEQAKQQALKQILNIHGIDQTTNNETFHKYLTDGIEVEYLKDGNIVGARVNIVDFEDPSNNEYLCINQFAVKYNNINKRPDIILFINGLPLVGIELKNPEDEKATLESAYNQFQTYKQYIPQLYDYNSLLVISDGIDAKYGSLTSPWTRFMVWKTKDGIKEDPNTEPQINTLINGLLKHSTLLEIIRDFTVFEKEKKYDEHTGLIQVETTKKIAAYHQYFAVKKAVKTTIEAASQQGNGKAGVMWHTQGSGKSLSMVFYAGKIVKELNNPTIVVITDRNDLDDQLFDTFAASKQLLRQEPIQAKSRSNLRELLNTTGGGIIFSTIQKFSPFENEDTFPLLSDRKNIVVISDEAHRSQYGFGAKTQYIKDKTGQETGTRTTYGYAKYLRDALPNASFIGFTGTPIEKEDRSTPAVFGNYIDIYDVSQAVEDGSTVRIYYESRLARIHLKEEYKNQLDELVDEISERENSLAEEAKIKWTKLEAIVGNEERIRDLARDIIEHYCAREETFKGKAMIVCMSRRIAVKMYEEIVKLKPEWHSDDKHQGNIKVIMTSSSTDPLNWQAHHTNKEDRKYLAQRFKDPDDPFQIAIVRDMWLTGFDVPCVTTMYIDKLMKGHTLMQSIARVNRVYKEKQGGLIVDYIGIASELKKALNVYAASGGKGNPILDINEALIVMKEKYEIVKNLLWGFEYERYFKADVNEKLTILLEAQEFILSKPNGAEEYIKYVTELSKAFALVVPHPDAMSKKEEIGLFQAIKARLIKYEPKDPGESRRDIETAIKQLVDKTVVSEGVIDIYQEMGIKSPDISILSDEFLEEVKNFKYKNLSIELLKKLINDEIKIRSRKNIIQSKKISEMLEAAIKKYQSNLLTSAEVINELIKIAKEIKNSDIQIKELGLSEEEIAFYDALANNMSAKEILGDKVLKEIAQDLVEQVKKNTSIDWTIRESVKARLRVLVKRTLRKYNYPPDKQANATEMVLKQAELFTENNI
ncbi:type I restriction endonuclease subunit R [Patescibacteria group bacterium]|nr:type I restriction endonuclease subunit R [Patescibacteria group bacterium]